jgi:hypothetical protein
MSQSQSSSPLRSGTIVYQTTLVGAGDALSSFELATLRHNLAMLRTVQFASGTARSDEVNADYGVRSPCVRLHRADRTTLYAKALHRVRFCLELPAPPELGGREGGLELSLDGETAVVAGWRCRRAIYGDGARQLAIAYTDEIAVDAPTGAVMQLDGVPGLVMAWEELPRTTRTSWWLRVAVTELSLAAPDPNCLALPDGYRRFTSIDEARAEDRKLVEAEAERDATADTASGRSMFAGRWRWAGGGVELEITGSGRDHRIRTITPAGAREERGAQNGRLLLVEEPPNFRLYHLDGHDGLVQSDDDAFRFLRQ